MRSILAFERLLVAHTFQSPFPKSGRSRAGSFWKKADSRQWKVFAVLYRSSGAGAKLSAKVQVSPEKRHYRYLVGSDQGRANGQLLRKSQDTAHAWGLVLEFRFDSRHGEISNFVFLQEF